MIIWNAQAGIKTISIVTELNYNINKCYLRDDSANIEVLFDIDDIQEAEWFVNVLIDVTEDLLDKRVYDLRLQEDDVIVYKDRVFVTDQSPEEFSVNVAPNDTPLYKPHSSTNEYITYG
jgi:hypothetical protein